MAKWNVEITESKIIRTLSFMGKDFQEVWEPNENGTWGSSTVMDNEVCSAFPVMDTDIANIIEEITCLDEDEMAEALATLSEYERNSTNNSFGI